VNVSLPDVGYSTFPSKDVILSHLAFTSSGVKSRLKNAPSLRYILNLAIYPAATSKIEPFSLQDS